MSAKATCCVGPIPKITLNLDSQMFMVIHTFKLYIKLPSFLCSNWSADGEADRVHVPRDAAGPVVPPLHGQDAQGHQGREHPPL